MKVMELNSWKSIYRSSSVISWITLLLIPVQIIIFIIWPPPTNELDFFILFQENSIIGLLNLDLLYLLTVIFMGYIYLGMYIGVIITNKPLAMIALFLGELGVAIYFVSNVSFEMLSLSNQYVIAESKEEHKALLTIGKMLLLRYKGTAFGVYYILNGFSLIIFSYAMLKSTNFTKRIAKWGLISGFLMLVPSTIGLTGMIFAMSSLIPTSVWLILIAKRFSTLAKN